MTEFAERIRAEKETLVEVFFSAIQSNVGQRIAAPGPGPEQLPGLRSVLDGSPTDQARGLTLALDGAASLGGVQQASELGDEEGRLEIAAGEALRRA